MLYGLDIINKYISKCASCTHNGSGQCGFINTCEPDECGMTLGEYEMMSSEEIELMRTRASKEPCYDQFSYTQLMDIVEREADDDDVVLNDDQINDIVINCYKMVEKARRNDASADGVFDRNVRDAVNIVLSYLDLRCLQHGKDAWDIISLYPYGYTRERGLYRYCPKAIVDNFLKNIQKTASINIESTVTSPADSHNEENETPSLLDEFLCTFTGREASDYIDALLCSQHFDFAAPFWESCEELGLFIICSLESWYTFKYNKWGELRDELSSKIRNLKNDETQLNTFISSLLLKFNNIKQHLHPIGKGTEYQLAELYLDILTHTTVDSLDNFSDIWKESIAEVKRMNLKGVDVTKTYCDQVRETISSKSLPYYADCGCQESWGLFNLRASLTRFIHMIEGCLLENGIENSLLYYQEICNVSIVSKLMDFNIALAMDWSLKTVYYYQSITGHHIETATSYEIQQDLYAGGVNAQRHFEPSPNLVYEVSYINGDDKSEEEVFEDTTEFVEAQPVVEETSDKPEEATCTHKAQPGKIMSKYLRRAAELYPGGFWHDDTIREYAFFLKELFRIVYKKEGAFNVMWSKLPIYPMSDGTTPSSRQLTNAIRSYDSTADEAICEYYRNILNTPSSDE